MTMKISDSTYYVSASQIQNILDEEEHYITASVLPTELHGVLIHDLQAEFVAIKAESCGKDLVGSSDEMASFAQNLRSKVDAAVSRIFAGRPSTASDNKTSYAALAKEIDRTSIEFPSYGVHAVEGAFIGGAGAYITSPRSMGLQSKKVLEAAKEWDISRKSAEQYSSLYKDAKGKYQGYISRKISDVDPNFMPTPEKKKVLKDSMDTFQRRAGSAKYFNGRATDVLQKELGTLSKISTSAATSVWKRVAIGGAIGTFFSILLEPTSVE